MNLPDIYTYLDYRAFLRDAQAAIKENDPAFSHRNIAARAGLKSPGHITWIYQGKRNLTLKLVPIFAEIFGIKDKPYRYFETLVQFNNAKKHSLKRAFFEELMAIQKSEKRVVRKEEYQYWSKWYHSVIRELVAILPVTDNYKSAAHQLLPKISPRELQQSLKTLERLGFIKKNENGQYQRLDKVISSGYEWKAFAILEYQRNLLDLAKAALNDIDKSERDISTLTLSISKSRFELIKDRIKTFREELINLAQTDTNPERIYQIGLLFFPVSQSNDGDKDAS